EERHDAVAGVLVDGSLVSVNAARKDPEQAIEQSMPFLGIDALRELHRAHDVGEEDGDQLALTPERALGRKNLVDEMPRRVGARLGGDCRRREVRATIVAEPRASAWRVFCSTSNTVVPARLISAMVWKMSLTINGARPSEGSSSIKSLGSVMSARPIASICCSPPDSVPAVCDMRSRKRGKSVKTRSRLSARRAFAARV